MKKMYRTFLILFAVLALAAFAAAGCSEEEKSESPSGGDPIDGDQDEELEGEGEDQIDPNLGSISGVVNVSEYLKDFDRAVQLYAVNPFTEYGATPAETFDIEGESGETDTAYSFVNLASGQYYIMLAVDVNNNDDNSDDVVSVYPDKVSLVITDPVLKDLADVDVYAGVQNESWGSVSGTLYIAEDYRNKRIIVVAAQELPEGGIDFWPSSADFTEMDTGGETRPFALMNLTDGSYYVIAFADMGAGSDPQLVPFISPYGPYEVVTSSADRKNYTGEVFYLGMDDPTIGSISGAITFPVAIPEDKKGLMGVYLLAYEDNVEVRSMTFVEWEEGETVYDYKVPNLVEQSDFWVAGFYKMDDDHLSLDFWSDPLHINLSVPEEKDWTGIDFEMAITELSGTVTLTGAPADYTNGNIFLTAYDGSGEIGGWVLVELPGEPTERSQQIPYTIYPAIGGSWTLTLAITGEGDSYPGDKWCYLTSELVVDGTQFTMDAGATEFIYDTHCVDAPEPEEKRK